MSLTFTGELCIKKMKNNSKFEKELTWQFKIYMRNLTNFYPNTTMKYLKNLQFNGLLLTNAYNF